MKLGRGRSQDSRLGITTKGSILREIWIPQSNTGPGYLLSVKEDRKQNPHEGQPSEEEGMETLSTALWTHLKRGGGGGGKYLNTPKISFNKELSRERLA